uniref:Uncharacterized protein n=1 Tax=Anguilla anguilla TaxID=7936 RepID=A0A0E9PQJ5_ANGAN
MQQVNLKLKSIIQTKKLSNWLSCSFERTFKFQRVFWVGYSVTG